MARTWARIASSILFVSLTIIDLSGIFSDATDHDEISKKVSPSPMVLPLYLSSPNNSRNWRDFSGDYRRRLLQKSNDHTHSAHMRLYDNLLINGYYTTRLWIGTPPQEFALIVDTGSTVTYVPCSNCEECGKHQDPRFQPELSSTYKPLKCNANCNCDIGGHQCTYERRYAEMSSSSGVLSEDILSFGNESELVPQRAVFGCENVETGDIYRQRADGIMGLGRGRLSVVDQLVDKGVISDSFSLCYGGMDVKGGAMVLGGFAPPSDMVFSHSDPYRSPYYNVDLTEIHVAGKPLHLSPKIFDGKYGTVLDSGTTYAYLPEEAFIALKAAIMKEIHPLKKVPGPDPNYADICFAGAGRNVSQLSKTFPEVNMVFGKGQKLSLSPENYLFRHMRVHGAYCLGIFQNGKDPTTLLGGIVVRNTLVTYDRENDKIGFWKTNCSELWKNLHVSETPAPAPAPAPVPVASFSRNSTLGMPPVMPPSGSPQRAFIGKFRIHLITFDMSFNINYSNSRPNFTELADFISHELEINASQVHLLNFTSNGNGSILRWAVYPAESDNYISNTTAMSIILRLTEHRLQLPKRFGSYQLLEWNVQPQKKLTWWQQHAFVVTLGVIVSMVFVISIFGIWFIWKRRQQAFGSYRPVDGIVPEQELQRL